MDNPHQSNFQFTNPVLTEMVFVVNQDYRPPEGDSQEIPIEIKVSKPDSEAYAKTQVASISLTAKIGEDKNLMFPCYLLATMTAKFRWEPSLPNEMVEAMLAQNAPSLLLGYLRPLIAQVTAASPVGIFHLPFMNFVQQGNRNT